MKETDPNSADINILLELSATGRILHYTVFKYGNCKKILESKSLDALNQAAQCPKCLNELIVQVYVPDLAKKIPEESWSYYHETADTVKVEEVTDAIDYIGESDTLYVIDETSNDALESGEVDDEIPTNVDIDDDATVAMEIEAIEPVDDTEMLDEQGDQTDYEAIEYLYDDMGDTMKPEDVQDEEDKIWECEVCFERYPSKASLSSHKRKHPELRSPTYCDICDRHFDKGVFWKKHMEVYHSDVPRYKKEPKTTQQCTLCKVELAGLGEIKEHMKAMHADAERFYCDHCPKNYYTKKHLRDHLMKKHFGRVPIFVCGICDPPKQFDTKYQLDGHFNTDHTREEMETRNKDRRKPCFKKEWRNEIGEFSCPRCLRIFNNRYSLGIHYVHCSRKPEPVGQIPTCDICSKTFTTWGKVKSHVLDVHEKRRRFTCEKCGQGFSHKGHYESHIELHNFDDPKPWKCEICGKGFKIRKQIDKHIILKHQPMEIRPYVCLKCEPEKRFLTSHDLSHHEKMVHTEKTLQCPHCPLMFKIEQQRKTHIRNIHLPDDEKPKYQCDQCSYSSSIKACFSSHLRQHQPKPFVCSVCEKGFVTNDLLKRHQLIHTDTRDFQCEVCHKRFRHKADLTTHFRLHTGQKPYECQVCSKRYSDRGCFRSHLLSHERQLGITLEKSVRKKADTSTNKVIFKEEGSEIIIEEEIMLS